jgi:hypothetical protein
MDKRQIEQKISLIPQNTLGEGIINDKEYLFLFKKTEKIITATYILSDFIPSTENLKKSLKDNSHDILDSVCDLLYKRGDRGVCVQRIKSGLIKLTSQYGLAEVSGHVTSMNGGILKNEIGNLLRILDSLERSFDHEQFPEMKQNYFNIDVRSKRQYSQRTEDRGQRTEKIYKGHDKGQRDTEMSDISSSSRIQNPESRIQNIKDVMKDKGLMSIKDISSVIIDCSEKTIQRTLNSMVEKGHIRRVGERRWARYELF